MYENMSFGLDNKAINTLQINDALMSHFIHNKEL